MDEDISEKSAPDSENPERDAGPPIIGIGSSAGGVDALLRLLPLIDPESGMAFVVVQHLDPLAKSSLTELLARASRMPVHLIEHDMPAAPNAVHVIPPNSTLTIRGRRLKLDHPAPVRGLRTPVDSFLMSLAEDEGTRAACVILSGAGSDGTVGLRAIKDHGGLTLAQAGAEYDGMMRSAVATGLVDQVLPLEQIPAKLMDYFRHVQRLEDDNGTEEAWRGTADYLGQVYALLRGRTGNDFKDYKDRTVVRRLQRRMQVLQIADVPGFIERLRQDPRELDRLLQELLIGVTGFFRDPQAFEALERLVIPRLFEGKTANDTVRVWVPGCSTGEEAYSIAILLREHLPKAPAAPALQIFASDIDERALEVARVGRYPASIVKDVPPERLERYFVREDGTYRIVSDLREICLFSQHNLLRDAPFSRLDLLSCRNLLIYLQQTLQDRVIPLFHYALRADGYLFLGTSENVTRHGRLFSVVDKASHIYQRRPPTERRLPEFPLSAPDATRHRPAAPARPGGADAGLQTLAERYLLERHAPPFVVVDQDGAVLQASTRTGRFLELPAGVPDTSLFSLARRGIRLELRAALHRAAATGQAVTLSNLSVATDAGQQPLELTVQPLRQAGQQDGLYLVVFKELGPTNLATGEAAGQSGEDVESLTLRQLELELRGTRERLQTTTEELESSNEELKSSNEELSSMNEELQSSNEELETSREELQSINEELQTVNAELNARVDELSRANSDMANLLKSTQIATLFLDRDLSVKSFTPAAKDLFRLVESDTGRPIGHVRARFQPESIQDDAERVLRTLATIERSVHSVDGDAIYVMRMLPYRTVDNIINGVVLTFTDVTGISAAEARISELGHDLRNRIESLETLLDLVPVGIFIVEDAEGERMRVNRLGAEMVGEPMGSRGMGVLTAQLRLRVQGKEIAGESHPLYLAARTGQTTQKFEAELLRPDGSALDVIFSVTPLFYEGGNPRGAVAAMVDIGDRKAAEAHQQILLHELQHRVKNILASVTALAARMLHQSESPEAFAETFIDRLHAMGRLHDILTQGNWKGTDIRTLVPAVLAPYGGGERLRLAKEDPSVTLRPGPTGTMGLVLHELATNAAKYGAFSTPGGTVAIHWHIEDPPPDRQLVLTWTETGGPPVTPPTRQGFGTRFVKQSVQYELEGTFELTFLPTGVRAVITFPLRADILGEQERAAVP